MKRLAGIAPPLLIALVAAATLAACGSSGGGGSQTARTASNDRVGTTVEQPPLGHNCQEFIAYSLGIVANRIYDAARHGNVVGQAVHRVETSTALARAVSATTPPPRAPRCAR